MDTRPLASILIPVFNRERFIRECVESALAQTVRDIEVVVSDNASNDRTLEICEVLATRDPRLHILRNSTNAGPLSNWHACAAAARGRYAHLLFSDDRASPDFLERMLPLLADPDVAFAFCQARLGTSPEAAEVAYRWKPRTGLYASKDFVRAQLYGDGTPLSPAAALFRLDDLRASLVRDAGDARWDAIFRGLGAGPDMLTYLLTARRYALVGYVAEPLVFFRAHSGSVTIARNTEVTDGYTRAAVWFLQGAEASRAELSNALGNWWLKKMRQQRTYVPWKTHAKRYTEVAARFPWVFVLASLLRIMTARIGRALRRTT